ncbi:MAG: phosphate ABC transporter permease subunit PstC [Spirochaeta sp. LUC14_002_19_P3]|nr:MAG: phosphate ABC transporter permease subunit PstC [Spirochaeta sp. LUC14_002_19_P3]
MEKAKTPLRERIIEGGLLCCGAVSVITTAAILVILLIETAGFFKEVSLMDFFADTQWTPLFSEKHFGIWPLLSGTLLTSAIAIAVALPMGLLAAIYLSEFAAEGVRKTLKPILEVLAGVPTIVYGYFALVYVTPILQKIIPNLSGFNALSPGLIMGIMIIPMVSSLSEDALHAIPATLKEGAFALGADKLGTLFRVTIPSALSGIMASAILAASRAIGETMIVAIAAGQQPRFTFDPRVPIETMTAYIVQISLGDTPTGSIAYKTIFVVGASLFIMTFSMNILSRKLVRRYRRGGS